MAIQKHIPVVRLRDRIQNDNIPLLTFQQMMGIFIYTVISFIFGGPSRNKITQYYVRNKYIYINNSLPCLCGQYDTCRRHITQSDYIVTKCSNIRVVIMVVVTESCSLLSYDNTECKILTWTNPNNELMSVLISFVQLATSAAGRAVAASLTSWSPTLTATCTSTRSTLGLSASDKS